MSKFKVGDKVIVKKTDYSFKKEYIGKTFTIRKIDPNSFILDIDPNGFRALYNGEHHYSVVEPCCYVFFESELELARNEEKIIITTDGKVITAKHYKDNKLVKTTESKCHPDDEFDFITGAKLAIEKMEEPKYYNGKVVCCDSNGTNLPLYTVGKIYEFVNGEITTDCGIKIPFKKCKSFEDWCKYSHSKWIEIKE